MSTFVTLLQLEIQVCLILILFILPPQQSPKAPLALICRKASNILSVNCSRILRLNLRGWSCSCFPWPHCCSATWQRLSRILWFFADPWPSHHHMELHTWPLRLQIIFLIHVCILSQGLSCMQIPGLSHKPLDPDTKQNHQPRLLPYPPPPTFPGTLHFGTFDNLSYQ